MQKLDRLGWVVGQSYEIGGMRIGVRTTSRRFGEWLGHVLEPYRIDGDPDSDFDDFSIVLPGEEITKGPARRGYHILYKGALDVYRTLDLPTFGRALISELEAFLYPDQEDAVYLDAVAVRVNGAVLLVPSFLSTILGRSGRRLARWNVALADTTRVAVDASGCLVTPSQLLNYSDDLFGYLEKMSGPTTEDRFSIEDPVPVDAVLFLDHQQESPLAPTSKGRALHHLASNTLNLSKVGGRSLPVLAQLVGGSRCYALGTLDYRQTLHALASAASNGSG
jgi:hypothetical protein